MGCVVRVIELGTLYFLIIFYIIQEAFSSYQYIMFVEIEKQVMYNYHVDILFVPLVHFSI